MASATVGFKVINGDENESSINSLVRTYRDQRAFQSKRTLECVSDLRNELEFCQKLEKVAITAGNQVLINAYMHISCSFVRSGYGRFQNWQIKKSGKFLFEFYCYSKEIFNIWKKCLILNMLFCPRVTSYLLLEKDNWSSFQNRISDNLKIFFKFLIHFFLW